MSTPKEDAVIDESVTKCGPSGVMTYRVTMQGNNGLLFVDVDAATGDGAAEAAHAKQPGNKVIHIEPAPQKQTLTAKAA